MATEPTHIITDNPNVVPVSRDLAYEIAAVSAAILDKEEEKTETAKQFTKEIKALKKRQRELITEIRSGNTQLAINFGSRIKEEIALAETAPDGDDDRDDGDELPQDEPSEPSETELADEAEATH